MNITKLGEYHVVQKLQEGSSGYVFAANDADGTDVIIKVIQSESLWTCIWNNRSILLSLPSDHMCKILNVTDLDGYHCIIESLVEGIKLNYAIEENTLTFQEFFVIVKDMIKALLQLHQKNMIYGDLKPDNVILKDGHAYLVDMDSPLVYLSEKYRFFGTLTYAAPEQIIYNKVSAFSDVYSLGILMYNMIQNDFPYSTDKKGIVDKVNGQYAISLNSVSNVSFKPLLTHLLIKMTDTKVQNRPDLYQVLQAVDEIQKMATDNELASVIRNKESGRMNFTASNMECLSKNVDHTFDRTCFLSNDDLRADSNNQSDDKLIDDAFSLIEKNVNDRKLPTENNYSIQLKKEYDQINKQASVSFWLWVSTFILGFGIIVVAVILAVSGHYLEVLTTVVLEALVYFVQRLFAIREEYYRKINSEKLMHLENGDNYEYIMKILETTRQEFREEKIDSLIKLIQEKIKN